MGARSGVAQTSLHEKLKVMVVVNRVLCDYNLTNNIIPPCKK